jgi:ATP-dependent protease ClpP protease subunit
VPAWNDLLDHFDKQPPEKQIPWLRLEAVRRLKEIGQLRGGRQVIIYSSAFLQKPQTPADRLQITHEDVNAFMSVMFGMKWSKGLTLLLHTPGGVTNATESIVAYLRSKFTYIEVIVPTFAMSAGTMISLAANRIVMGRQSQLGPIDPQFLTGQRAQSAQAVVDQFDQAKKEILANSAAAGVWFPILQTIGPALLQEARNALAYGERMVAEWLEKYMFAGNPNAASLAQAAAKHFNDAATHKSHGRRIDRDEARAQQLVVEDLEANQKLQEAVLTVYHLITIAFEKGPASKILLSDTDRMFVKNWGQPQVQIQPVPIQIPFPAPAAPPAKKRGLLPRLFGSRK